MEFKYVQNAVENWWQNKINLEVFVFFLSNPHEVFMCSRLTFLSLSDTQIFHLIAVKTDSVKY